MHRRIIINTNTDTYIFYFKINRNLKKRSKSSAKFCHIPFTLILQVLRFYQICFLSLALPFPPSDYHLCFLWSVLYAEIYLIVRKILWSRNQSMKTCGISLSYLLNLVYFRSVFLSLFLKVLTIWKRTGQLFYTTFLSFVCLIFAQHYIKSVLFGGRNTRGAMPCPQCIRSGGTWLSFVLLYLWLILITWIRCCLPGFSTVKFLFLALQLWGDIWTLHMSILFLIILLLSIFMYYSGHTGTWS